jgi:hypothetical protein
MFGKKNTPELKRKGAGLNQLIARTHKLNGQLLGLQITNGNLIAICFSAMQITGGVVLLAATGTAMGYYAFALIPICLPLAVLVERLSLGGLMVFRTAGVDKRGLEDDFYLKHIKREATEREKYEYKRQLKLVKKDRRLAFVLILLGIFISGYAGDQLWQLILHNMLLSILIASTVSLTFVFSELYGKLSTKGIKDAMTDDEIAHAVLSNAEEELKIELSMEAFGNMRGDPEKRKSIVNKIETGLTTRLEAFADRAEYLLSEGHAQAAHDDLEPKEIAAPRKRDNLYRENREVFAEFMERFPKATLSMITKHFHIAQSTASEWRQTYREEALRENFKIQEEGKENKED